MTKAANSILCLVTVLALGACASSDTGFEPIALSPDDASALVGRSATNSVYQKPDFIVAMLDAQTPGTADDATMAGDPNAILTENKIGDPAPVIARQLGKMLAKQYGLQFSAAKRSAFASAEVADVTADIPDPDILVDVQTLQWGLFEAQENADGYRLQYDVRMRLVDNPSGRILAQEICAHMKLDDEGAAAPDYDALTAGGAAALKQELLDAAIYCTRRFMSVLFQG